MGRRRGRRAQPGIGLARPYNGGSGVVRNGHITLFPVASVRSAEVGGHGWVWSVTAGPELTERLAARQSFVRSDGRICTALASHLKDVKPGEPRLYSKPFFSLCGDKVYLVIRLSSGPITCLTCANYC